MFYKEILKAIQLGNITKTEGVVLLKGFKNFDVSMWVRNDSKAIRFFELCEKAGLNVRQLDWVE